MKAGSFWQPLWMMSKKSHHTDYMPVGSGFPLRGFSLYLLCYLFSTRIYDLLLMVQKNKLLGCIKPNEYWDIYHINWLPPGFLPSKVLVNTHVRCLELQPPGQLLLLACGSLQPPWWKIVDSWVNTLGAYVLCGLISFVGNL